MPPRRKRSHKSDLDRLKKLSETLGIDVNQLLEEVPLTEIGEQATIRRQAEAESVLFYVNSRGKNFESKPCKYCGKLFLHTYINIEYCSESCRAQALAELGIIWNYNRLTDSQRWNVNNTGLVPKIIGADATDALIESGNYFIGLTKWVPCNPEFLADVEMDNCEGIPRKDISDDLHLHPGEQ